MTEFQWNEYNPEFGNHCLKHRTRENDNSTYHTMEFDDLENIPKISLRGKTNISGSTGLTIWTCSQILSGYLDDNADLIKDKYVLELGAGLGLCSIAIHHLGAGKVLATDGDVDVLDNLRYNIGLNVPDRDENGIHYSMGEDEIDEEEKKRCEDDCSKRTIWSPQLVWANDLDKFEEEHSCPDIIVGTDVLYFARSLNPLWETVDTLLKPEGKFILSFATHCVSVGEVLDKARHYGFKWKKPNITGGDEEEKQEVYEASTDFAYHIFIFSRAE